MALLHSALERDLVGETRSEHPRLDRPRHIRHVTESSRQGQNVECRDEDKDDTEDVVDTEDDSEDSAKAIVEEVKHEGGNDRDAGAKTAFQPNQSTDIENLQNTLYVALANSREPRPSAKAIAAWKALEHIKQGQTSFFAYIRAQRRGSPLSSRTIKRLQIREGQQTMPKLCCNTGSTVECYRTNQHPHI